MAPKVLFIIDATGSMSNYLSALKDALWEVFTVSKLGTPFEVGIIWYRDYSDSPVTGYLPFTANLEEAYKFISKESANGGGDDPEALKTALSKAIEVVDKETIVILYTDAPPHSAKTGGINWTDEKKVLPDSDWVSLCKKLQGVPTYSLYNRTDHLTIWFLAHLSSVTGGKLIPVESRQLSITMATMHVLLSVMGHTTGSEGMKYIPFGPNSQYSNEEHFLAKVTFLKKEDLVIYSLPSFKCDNLVTKFDNDASYRDRVYATFKEVLNPEHVLILTTNAIFGLLWRAICKRRYSNGEELEQRRIELLAQLDGTLRGLNTVDANTLRKWIAESYNSIEEINETLSKVEQFPALINTGATLSREEVMLITRECTAKSVKNVISLLSSLTLITTPPPKGTSYLPLALRDDEFFSIIPHLFAPGLKFSFRPAVFIATLLYLQDHLLLRERAGKYLEKSRGKWFDKELPENYTFTFISFMLKVPEFLTNEEYKLFRGLHTAAGIKHNLETRVTITVPWTPSTKILYPDFKRECSRCHQKRSETIFAETGVCGLCHYEVEGEEKDVEKSHLAQCRDCQAIYAIIRIEKFIGIPKCHACRVGVPSSTISCEECGNKFCSLPGATHDGYKCKMCLTTGGLEEKQVPFNMFVDEKIHAALGVEIKGDVTRSLFAMKEDVKVVPITPLSSLEFKKKKVFLEKSDPVAQVASLIKNGSSESVTCYLCGENKLRNNIYPACGGCPSEACGECLKGWYGQFQPGKVVNVNSLTCPFCKRLPSMKTLKMANKQALAIHRVRKHLDPQFYYAWCLGCYQVKEYREKACGEEIPDLKDFKCVECTSTSITTTTCPGCKVEVQKESGCDHITCLCGTHFCYVCGEAHSPEEIYEHIYTAHSNVDDDAEE
jgi:hypothetical protein